MSAWTYEASTSLAGGDEPASQRLGAGARPGSLPLRLAAFFGFAAFAAVQFSTLLLHPPTWRVLAVATIATAGAGALAAIERLPIAPRVTGLLAVLAMVAVFLGGLLAIGVPAHLFLPPHWGSLVRDMHRGYDGLAGWLWPYRDEHVWPRLAVLAVLPLAGMLGAAISFWPSGRGRDVRRLAGTVPLVAVFLCGVVNEVAPLWRFQGVVLLALIFAWFSLPTLRGQDVNRAVRWLVGCTALALAVAPAFSASRPWIDYAGWNPLPNSTVFQWDQTYGPNTWSRSTTTMLEVAELHPRLLRVTTLDRFDGLRFLRSSAPPGSARLDEPPGKHPVRSYERATVTVAGLRSSLLVGASGLPVEVSTPDGGSPVNAVQADGTLVAGSPLAKGTRYSVVSYAPHPSAAVLRRVTPVFPLPYLAYTQFVLPSGSASALATPNLSAESHAHLAPASLVGAPAPGRTPASDPSTAARIEASPYGPMFTLARHLATGTHSDYEVAKRIEGFLRKNYTYSLDPPKSRYPLESFLFKDRRGYCQQFSGAMALLLRMDGIPARVAVGFKPGVYDAAAQRWLVRALDAHAWVEVYFAGIGWVSFDPTPPAREPAATTSLQSKAVLLGLHNGESGSPTHAAKASIPLASLAKPGHGGSGTLRWALIGLIAALLALLSGWWALGARRLRRGLRGDAAGAVEELVGALGRLGHALPAGTTLSQWGRRLSDAGQPGAARYVLRLGELRYGPSGSAYPASAGPSLADRRRLRQALGGRRPIGRLRALLALPPGAARRA
ncbi:MAG TPA: transglutaminaseTgpA domain-containing protein [Solirubrobacteraceae bacterium]